MRGLENTLIKLLLSTEFFDEANRKKIGIGEHLTGWSGLKLLAYHMKYDGSGSVTSDLCVIV